MYKQIEAAQVVMEAKDLATAELVMNELKAEGDKLNDYEKSQMYNFLAVIHYVQGKSDLTIADYVAILKLEKSPGTNSH